MYYIVLKFIFICNFSILLLKLEAYASGFVYLTIHKVVYKCLSQPHRQLRHGKLKKTQLREETNGPLHS